MKKQQTRRKADGAKRPGGETSWGRNVLLPCLLMAPKLELVPLNSCLLSSSEMQHMVPNKRPPCNVIITSSNIDRFSKLFHQLIRKIKINQSLKFSAQLKRVTTLPCQISNFKIEAKVPKPQKKFKVKPQSKVKPARAFRLPLV